MLGALMQTTEINSPAHSKTAVIITGATGGIAQHFLKQALTRQANHFVLVSRDVQRLQEMISPLLQTLNNSNQSQEYININQRVHILQADVSDLSVAENLLSHAQNQFPDLMIKHLVHAIGSILIAPLHRTTLQQYLEIMNTNTNTSFFVLKSFINHILAAKQQGIISLDDNTSAVLFSSVASQIGIANHEAIAVAKAGVESLIKSSAATYCAQNIRINGIAPGLTDTPLAERFLKTEASRQVMAKQYPLEGLQSADDIVQGILYLLEQQRSTGQILSIDGGFSVIRPLVK
jgi:NAD(P)-dependent dehydrogenase (short-subunit alcohol dehydrogenase family)